ncbi:MAG: hypothetical protein HUU01_11245 [Saprospiraceae bacterium]|nr:hypothetical protein [Saprospiraceae bacterium]
MNILATTNRDSHGDIISLEALQQMCDIMNGERTVRMGINHNPLLPPLGQYSKAYIVKDERGEYLLCADPILLDNYEIIDEKENLVHNFRKGLRGFNEVRFEAPDNISVDVDFFNFSNPGDADKFFQELIEEVDRDIEVFEKIRKELHPDPELIITLTKAFLGYKILKPIAEKLSEKVAEKIAEDLATNYEKIKKIIKKSLHFFDKKYKKITLIIEIPNSEIHIELATTISIENIKVFMDKLTNNEIEKVVENSLKMKHLFNGEKIQFVLSDGAEWEFTYMLTKEGGVIGKKHLFEIRNQQYKVLLDRGQIFNSFGARIS